jgi:uncharacterized protein (DUF342 family)
MTMTFDQIAATIRKCYPTASEVTLTIRADNMQMHVLIEKPTRNDDPVTQLDGTVLTAGDAK